MGDLAFTTETLTDAHYRDLESFIEPSLGARVSRTRRNTFARLGLIVRTTIAIKARIRIADARLPRLWVVTPIGRQLVDRWRAARAMAVTP